MEFKKAILEASAEIYGQGTQERVSVKIGDTNKDLGELRSSAPFTHSAIIKSANYAKKQGFDMSADKVPADITIMGDGNVILVDDKSGKKIKVTLKQLGYTPAQIGKIQAEIA